MTRKISFSIDEYYHIYNRGTDKRIIFTNQSDYNRFIKILEICNSVERIEVRNFLYGGPTSVKKVKEELVDIGAYVLMPNHFHILVREKTDGGISKFMKKLLTAYSMYFNKKYQRTGSLFEGRFQAKHADTDEYLKYLFAYIHLNPVKIVDPEWKENGISDIEKAKKYLMDYKYSSYLDYMGQNREESVILNKSTFPEYFSEFKDFDNFINTYLEYKSIFK